jgi:hypothetical protein
MSLEIVKYDICLEANSIENAGILARQLRYGEAAQLAGSVAIGRIARATEVVSEQEIDPEEIRVLVESGRAARSGLGGIAINQ